MIKRYLIPSDYSPAKSWQLVEWCMRLGANEFTIDFLSSTPSGDASQDGSFEDPILYRDGEFILGVLSHEAFAVMRLTASEAEDLEIAGFPSHESLPRIG